MPLILAFGFFFLLLALLSVFFYLSLSKKVEPSDIARLLESASSETMRKVESRTKMIETEWETTYQQFRRMLGRADKLKGLEAPKTEEPAVVAAPQTRGEILRRARAK